MRDWPILAAIIAVTAMALAHRPVTVYVWARDVSVCASVEVGQPAEQQ